MTLPVVAQEATTFRGVLLLVVGLAMIGAGTFAVLKPEKAVQLSYAWRRWWARSLSLGKLDASEPVYTATVRYGRWTTPLPNRRSSTR